MSFHNSPAAFTGVPIPDFEEKRSFLRAHVRINYPTIVLFAGVAFFTFALFSFLFSLPSQKAAAENVVVPVQTAHTTSSAGAPPLEMHIASNGLMLLRSARVASVSGTTLTVSTMLGSVDFTWLVHTNASSYEKHDFGTRFLNRNGQKISFQDIRTGDVVTITGMLGGTAENLTLDADSVRSLEE